jgi:hypothetical protein
MARKKRDQDDEKKKWPHGQATINCPICGGTGMNRRAADEYVASRVDYSAQERPPLECPGCVGRGRILLSSSSATAATAR